MNLVWRWSDKIDKTNKSEILLSSFLECLRDIYCSNIFYVRSYGWFVSRNREELLQHIYR